MRMKDRTRLAGAMTGGIATVLVITLAGCTPGEPDMQADAASASPAPTSAAPSPSPTERGDSGPQHSPEEQAAIDDAKAAVLRFSEVRDEAFGDPANADPAAFDAVAIDPVRSEYNSRIGAFREENLHQTGAFVLTFTEVDSVGVESDPENFVYPKVVFSLCADRSSVDLVDESGTSVMGEGSDIISGAARAYEEPGEGWLVEYWELGSEDDEVCGG